MRFLYLHHWASQLGCLDDPTTGAFCRVGELLLEVDRRIHCLVKEKALPIFNWYETRNHFHLRSVQLWISTFGDAFRLAVIFLEALFQ